MSADGDDWRVDGSGYRWDFELADKREAERDRPAAKPARSRARNSPPPAAAGDDRPLIRVVAGELNITVTAAEDALLAAGVPIFQRGEKLVQPIEREVPASRGRMVLTAGLGELTIAALTDHLCAVASWERFDGRAGNWVRINPPRQVAETLLARHGRWRFPSVAGIITTPTLRPDGSLTDGVGLRCRNAPVSRARYSAAATSGPALS